MDGGEVFTQGNLVNQCLVASIAICEMVVPATVGKSEGTLLI